MSVITDLIDLLSRNKCEKCVYHNENDTCQKKIDEHKRLITIGITDRRHCKNAKYNK